MLSRTCDAACQCKTTAPHPANKVARPRAYDRQAPHLNRMRDARVYSDGNVAQRSRHFSALGVVARATEGSVMAGKPDTGTLEFEKVSLTDARKALEETGPAAYATPKKTEDWEAKRS